ncbi:MAG: hypothetical protein Q9167_003469 [Letrouitia subvulpina]
MLGITGASMASFHSTVDTSIADLEPFIHKRVELLCGSLRSQSRKGPIDAHALFLAFANDTACAYAFDYSMNLLEEPERALDWKMTIKAIASLTPFIKQFPWIIPIVKRVPGWLRRLLSPKMERLLSLQADMNREAAKAIQIHQNPNGTKKISEDAREQKPRLFQQMIESNLPVQEKEAQRMGQEGFSIIAAGGETVARTLATLTYHLIANPSALSKLREELRTAQPDPSIMPQYHELERLPWLTAVIKEAMRCWGVMASRSPLVSPTPLPYNGWIIPAGTPIGMTMMNVLHDPIIYPSPHTFDPSRWLDLAPDAPPNQHFVCFGKGSRMCIGRDLANAELYLAVAALFRRFELQLFDTERERDVESTRDCFTGEASRGSQGVRVQVVGELND